MPTLTIIENLNVVEHIGSGFRPSLIMPTMNPLSFEKGKETFHHRVIIAIPCPAHAACDPVVPQKILELVAGILTAAIGVMNEAWSGRASA